MPITKYSPQSKTFLHAHLKLKICFFIHILVPFICDIQLNAQTVRPADGRHQFHNYTVEDGLVQSVIEAIYQDSRGYMWFGTHGGASRFDGRTWLNFKANENFSGRVQDITEDHEGNIWFATTNGVSKLTLHGNGSTTNGEFERLDTSRGLPSNFTRAVLTDSEGNIWAGTALGPAKFNGKNFEAVEMPLDKSKGNTELIRKSIFDMCEDSQGRIWFCIYGGYILRWEDEVLSIVHDIGRGSYECIMEDSKGNIWVTSWGSRLLKYDGEKLTEYGKYTNTSTIGITEDKQGNIWIATFEQGIFRFVPPSTEGQEGGNTFYQYTQKEGIPILSNWAMMTDREGNIWVGTFGAGVCKYTNDRFTAYDEEFGLLNNTISGILEDSKGDFWFATEGGVTRYSYLEKNSGHDGLTHYTEKDGLKNNKVNAVAEDATGNIWIATYASRRGTSVLKNGELKYLDPTGSAGYGGFHILRDHVGNMWVHNRRYSPGWQRGDTVESYLVPGGRNKNKIMASLEDRHHNIWFGVYGGGANVLSKDSIWNICEKQGFTDKMVYCIVEDEQGDLWFSTDGDGVWRCRFDTTNNELVILDTITTKDGLSDNIARSLVFNGKDELFIGTMNGLSRLNLSVYRRTGDIEITNYGKLEGFSGLECNQNSVCRDRDGKLWFGTVKGAIRYNSEADTLNKTRPLMHITNLLLFQKQTDWRQYSDSIDQKTGLALNLIIPYDQNHLTFQYIGISLTVPEKVRYQYKLQGFDKEWLPITEKTEATYSNLDPGEYTFKVKASNNDGVWNQTPTAFAFIISPPYWETGWFYSGQLLFFMLLIGGTMVVSRRYRGGKLLTILVYITLFVIFEFIQNICEPFYEQFVGGAPIIKTILNLILASTLLPVQLLLSKYLRGKGGSISDTENLI